MTQTRRKYNYTFHNNSQLRKTYPRHCEEINSWSDHILNEAQREELKELIEDIDVDPRNKDHFDNLSNQICLDDVMTALLKTVQSKYNIVKQKYDIIAAEAVEEEHLLAEQNNKGRLTKADQDVAVLLSKDAQIHRSACEELKAVLDYLKGLSDVLTTRNRVLMEESYTNRQFIKNANY